MNRTWLLVLLCLMLSGLIIVVLPDSDKRLFSISKDHGPSLQDAIGLLLILFPYCLLLIEAWKRKDKLLKYKNSIGFRTGLLVFAAGFGLIVVSVMNDYKYWWIFGIILTVIIQIIAFYRILK